MKCSQCKKDKSPSEFVGKFGTTKACSSCRALYSEKAYERYHGIVNPLRKRGRPQKPLDELTSGSLLNSGRAQLFKIQKGQEQQGLCAICGKARKLFLDHCHKTKRFRALLCTQCNTGIGMFHEDPETLEKAATYLRTYQEVPKNSS